MTKKDYIALAKAIKRIDLLVRTRLHDSNAGHNEATADDLADAIRDCVTAQIAMVLAEDSKSFNSFTFDAYVKSTKP